MKIEWLKTVAMVAKLNSFSEAAMEIPCAQSSVSRQVKCVEDEMGVVFFNRSSNSNTVQLTETGRNLMPALQKLLDDYDDLLTQADSSRKSIKIQLGLERLVFSSAAKGRLIGRLYLKYPGAELQMEEMPRESMAEMLLSGKADAVLYTHVIPAGETSNTRVDDNLFRWSFLGTEKLAAAVPSADPLAKRAGISLAELAEREFIFHSDILKYYAEAAASERSSMFIKFCLANGFTPKIRTVGRHLADITEQLVSQGQGVYPSMVPAFLREYPGVVYVPLENAPYTVQYYMLSLKSNRSPGIRILTDFLQEQFAAADKESPYK